MVASQLNPLFKYLIGSPILLRLACVLSSLSLSRSTKVENGRLVALDLVKKALLLAVGFIIWVTHSVFEHLPSIKIMERNSTMDDSLYTDNAMHRALCQVLALVNDTPVSSEKYEYARSLVDKIIIQNISHGDPTLWDTNKVALQAAFSRTMELLALSLELQQQQEVKGNSWSWSLARSVFSRGHVGNSPNNDLSPFSIEKMCLYICNLLFPMAALTRMSSELPPLMSVSSGSSISAVAEKLSQELVWITEKFKECSSIYEASRMWSTDSRLSKLSVSAHPRVQASLLRVSVLLLKELALCESDYLVGSLKADLLQLWLPLFCHAKSGLDSPSFTPTEKASILRSLEENIMSLNISQQENVLTGWLKEYVSSPSEWPNLQHCFENWCTSLRKKPISLSHY